MINLVEKYINNMTINDIKYFANKNNLKYSEEEINFVYTFIKNNYKSVLNNPKSFNLATYKNKLSPNNYYFIESLINKYSKFLAK